MRRERVAERIRQLSPAKRQLLGRLLAEQSFDPAFLDTPAVSPKSPLEELLTNIWQEVLGVERIGTEDNFFDLGGDSILSIRIVAKAQARGVTLTSRQLFENPTVSLLARSLEFSRNSSPAASRDQTLEHRDARQEPRSHEDSRRNGTELSPADFPEAELSQEDLLTILSRLAAQADLESLEPAQPLLQRAAAL